MPIRFRCAYCNQLMGIARRKAGAVVKCPKCAGEIIVPVPEGTDAADGPDEPGDGAFEQPNFDPAAEAPPSAAATAAEQPPEPAPVPPLPPPAPKRFGIFLSIGMLFISVLVIILLLILMFVLGLIIGKQSAPEAKDARTLINEPRPSGSG